MARARHQPEGGLEGRLWSVRRTNTLPDPPSPTFAAPAAHPVLLSGWLLLVTLATALGAAFWRRPDPPPDSPRDDDDLASLGLSEVRVASPASETEEEPTPKAPAKPAAAARPEPTEMTARPMSTPRPRPQPSRTRMNAPYVREGTPLWSNESLAAGLLLSSLADHVGGPSAVFRLDEAAGTYTIEAFGGDGDVPEAVPAEGSPLHRVPQDHVVTHLDADHLGGLDAFGPHGACVRALAEPPAPRVLLVVGLPGDEPDDGVTRIVGRYSDLVAQITALEPEPVEEPTPEADEAPPVPRAVVIREEQEACAEAGTPLAFALVTLAEAEELLTQATPEAVAAAEAALRARLGEAPDVRRVEPFGDLLFGAFLDLDREGAAAWCRDLAKADPPLFIGAVAPADGDPQAIREAATEALRDAYDQQRSQVVGVE